MRPKSCRRHSLQARWLDSQSCDGTAHSSEQNALKGIAVFGWNPRTGTPWVLCYGGAGVVLFNNIRCTVLTIRTYMDSIDVLRVHRRSMTYGRPQTEMTVGTWKEAHQRASPLARAARPRGGIG